MIMNGHAHYLALLINVSVTERRCARWKLAMRLLMSGWLSLLCVLSGVHLGVVAGERAHGMA